MAHKFDGVTSKLVLGASLVSAAPLTFACFVKPTALGTSYFLMVADDGTVLQRFTMTLNGSNQVSTTTTATTSATVATTDTYALNKWFAAAAVHRSAASRFAVLDGRFGAENTTSRTPTGINALDIGTNSTGTFFFSGLMAEVAVWAEALTPSELSAHAAGIPASEIRPQSLLLYLPLTSQLGIQDIGPRSLVFANTAVIPVGDHPRVFRPVKHKLQRSAFARTH